MRRILLLIPATSYRATAFIEAARAIGVDITVGSNHKSTLAEMNPAGFLSLDIGDIPRAVETARSFSRTYPMEAVVGVDDQSVITASAIAEELNLPHNTIISVTAACNKYIMREFLSQHNIPQPNYRKVSIDEPLENIESMVTYPAVLKPVTLSGSRGVVKVTGRKELHDAVSLIRKIVNKLDSTEVTQEGRSILIEEYIEGDEVAVEGLLHEDYLQALALFDKPDPLRGPYFEETIYTTPSRLSDSMQSEIFEVVKNAARALKLVRGPVHAEVRFNAGGVYLIELAARSIGGYCARVLRFEDPETDTAKISLEELILRDALREPVQSFRREEHAAGVMMIPVPGRGVVKDVYGREEAMKVPYITDVIITATRGEEIIPLPEGGKYPGFIFARADNPADAEQALRRAHSLLRFELG